MKNKVIALDSNIFIYHFEKNPQYISFTRLVFKGIINKSFHGISSVISLIEVLSYPAPDDVLLVLEDKFRSLPNFTLFDITKEIGSEAARIRRRYGFRLPDSIQLATARVNKADSFITNDARLQKFKEIKVILLPNFS